MAFGEPPDSGVRKFADAIGATTSEARRATARIRRAARSRERCWSRRKAARILSLRRPRRRPRPTLRHLPRSAVGAGPATIPGAVRAAPILAAPCASAGPSESLPGPWSRPGSPRRCSGAASSCRRGGVMAAAAIAPAALAVAAPRSRGPRPGTADAEHVGLPGRLRVAQRRPAGAGRADAHRLSDRRRPRDRVRRAADAAPAARPLAPGPDQPSRAGAGVVPLGLVPGPARQRAVRPAAPARPVRGGRRAHVRGVRPRRRLLLDHPDRSAVVRRASGSLRRRRFARAAADDDRVRGAVLGRTLA